MQKENKIIELIDNLAGMMKRGFDAVDRRLDGIDRRLEGVETRLNEVESGLGEIKHELEALTNVRFGGHENRICNLEDDMRVVKTKVGIKLKQ